jgi:hypothetical protein
VVVTGRCRGRWAGRGGGGGGGGGGRSSGDEQRRAGEGYTMGVVSAGQHEGVGRKGVDKKESARPGKRMSSSKRGMGLVGTLSSWQKVPTQGSTQARVE